MILKHRPPKKYNLQKKNVMNRKPSEGDLNDRQGPVNNL